MNAKHEQEEILRRFEEMMNSYKPTEEDKKIMRKVSTYPMYGGLFGSIAGGLLSNRYIASRITSGGLSYKLAINLVMSTAGFFTGTMFGAVRGAKMFFASDAPLADEYRKLLEMRKSAGKPLPYFLRDIDTRPRKPSEKQQQEEEEDADYYPQNVPRNNSSYISSKSTASDSDMDGFVPDDSVDDEGFEDDNQERVGKSSKSSTGSGGSAWDAVRKTAHK